jgi:hypothetical protein
LKNKTKIVAAQARALTAREFPNINSFKEIRARSRGIEAAENIQSSRFPRALPLP